MSDNLKIWNELKSVPTSAKKTIVGGRLKGMTDIKPQWRLQMMTEQFGVIGVGWYYEIVKTWTENHTVDDNKKEISAHVMVNLFIKADSEWSKPIVGIGGSMLLAIEKYSVHHSDEAYKMATTDALSVAMKQLGVAADVYMGLSDSKYDKPTENTTQPAQKAPVQKFEDYKKMTGKQKGTLKDQIIELEKNGSESCNRAITAVMELLGRDIVDFDSAAHMINKVKLTLEKANVKTS